MGLLDRLARLGVTVFERGWLSSNNILIVGRSGEATLVDSGYSTHAEQTVSLVEAALQGKPLVRVINTHLHSDHCGGNAALHSTWSSDIWVPAPMLEAAASWDENVLLFRGTGQRCDRFPVHGALSAESNVVMGDATWEIHPAPGHDPHAVMLFQPQERVLISGDALWEHRVAVVFPELVGEAGFENALNALDTIERLAPEVVIPGHGEPFRNAARAIDEGRSRLRSFARTPHKHYRYAVRALTMFHMLEHRIKRRSDLTAWICATPLLASLEPAKDSDWVEGVVDGLVDDGILDRLDDWLSVPDA